MAKPKFKPTKKQLVSIEHFASIGLLKKDIAALLGYNQQYFSEVLKNTDVLEAYLTGKAKGKSELLNASIRRASDDRRKDCTVNAHYLLNRMERNDVDDVDATVDVVDDATIVAQIALELKV